MSFDHERPPSDEGSRDSFRLLGPNRILVGEPGEISFNRLKLLSDKDRLDLQSTRSLVLNIFGSENFSEINASGDADKLVAIKNKLTFTLGNRYGLEGNFKLINAHIDRAMGDVNNLIDKFENPESGLLRELRQQIESVEEMKTINDPVDLVKICFSNHISERMKYEARRKLELFDLAMRVNSRREKIEPMKDRLNRFLSGYVWADRTGETKKFEFISQHAEADNGCIGIRELGKDEKISLQDNEAYHLYPMRRFVTRRGDSDYAYTENRMKSTADIVLKLLRKNTRDSHVVDDILGFKFVMTSDRSIQNFLERIQAAGFSAGTAIDFEDVYHTVGNGHLFKITNSGSAENLEIVKMHMMYQGMRVELQMHDIKSHINSRYKDGVGWEEFSIKRLIDRGKYNTNVLELLYPKDIYGDLNGAMDRKILDIRRDNRQKNKRLPAEHRMDVIQ